MVMIIDLEEGQSRLLSIDDTGVEETPVLSIDALTMELLARQPELILLNPGALELTGGQLADALNRLGRFQPHYSLTETFQSSEEELTLL